MNLLQRCYMDLHGIYGMSNAMICHRYMDARWCKMMRGRLHPNWQWPQSWEVLSDLNGVHAGQPFTSARPMQPARCSKGLNGSMLMRWERWELRRTYNNDTEWWKARSWLMNHRLKRQFQLKQNKQNKQNSQNTQNKQKSFKVSQVESQAKEAESLSWSSFSTLPFAVVFDRFCLWLDGFEFALLRCWKCFNPRLSTRMGKLEVCDGRLSSIQRQLTSRQSKSWLRGMQVLWEPSQKNWVVSCCIMLYCKCSNSVSWFCVPNCKVFVWKVSNSDRKWWLDKANSWCCRQDLKRSKVSRGHGSNAWSRLNSLLHHLTPHYDIESNTLNSIVDCAALSSPTYSNLLSSIGFPLARPGRVDVFFFLNEVLINYLLCPSSIPPRLCAQADATYVQRSPQSSCAPKSFVNALFAVEFEARTTL